MKGGFLLEGGKMFQHIFLPTDGSELSFKTAQEAMNFAKEIHAKITVFFAQPEYPAAYFGESALADPSAPEHFTEMTNQKAERYLSDIQKLANDAGVECKTISSVSDSPYRAIVENATKENCDLIFMASHGRHGLVGLLLGSETKRVIDHSPIPVLVYR